MVYYLSVSNPYETSFGCEIFDDSREKPLFEMEYLDPDHVDWRARKRTIQMLHGYPVVVETAPKKVYWDGGNRALPDVLMHGGVMIVCERLRELIEQFEPNVHQLIPVHIYKSKNSDQSVKYYWFNICNRIDSVDPLHTTYRLTKSHEETSYWEDENIENAKLVFNENKSCGRHFWLDPHLMVMRHGLCSASFGDAAISGNFSGLNVTPRETV